MKVDLSNLEIMLNGDKDSLKRVLTMIIDKAPASLEKIRTGLNTLNYSVLKSAAHSLKPQMSYIGNTEIFEMVSNIEKYSLEKKDFVFLKDQIENFENEYQCVIFELNKCLDTL